MDFNFKQCWYCSDVEDYVNLQRLQCTVCKRYVHSKCLQRGSLPGGLTGDVFFEFTCMECSVDDSEHFIRERMSWLQVVSLVLYHMQHKCFELSKNGYFHWKTHVVAFINSNWGTLFRKDVRPKKTWNGTVAGILSHYSPQFFMSGTLVLNEQGWWALTYPQFTPTVISELNAEIVAEKHKRKGISTYTNEISILKSILETKSYVTEEMLNITNSNMNILQPTNQSLLENQYLDSPASVQYRSNYPRKNPEFKLKTQNLLPTIENINHVNMKQDTKRRKQASDATKYDKPVNKSVAVIIDDSPKTLLTHKEVERIQRVGLIDEAITRSTKFLSHQYYYNTCIQNLNSVNDINMKSRLVGRIQRQNIISPYSYLSLCPYIWQDTSINPPWLQLMDEIKANVSWRKKGKWKLRPRSSLDFMYFQPEHVAAVNTLCAHYFWTGIDLSDALQYPDYTCVVLYKKLVVAFTVIVPNVTLIENYISFIFTRPGWRNCGIARFMLYHVIQASSNRDITLHVSLSNPALCFYQKYGFKVERVVLDFYDKFIKEGSRESKHAFFCRLER